MKISTRGKYGLLAMLNLAVQSDSDPVTLSSIAERYKISASYLEQVFANLRKAGLIKSFKGAQGGYVLTRQPSETTVGEILRVLEGALFEAPLPEDEQYGINDSMEYCLKRKVWDKIDHSIRLIVDNTTLEDLVKEYLQTREILSYMPNL